MNNIYTDTKKRQDFLILFDVADGNPNGDPDAGNLPRVDPETMQGLVTDVALKRKIRNYVDALHGQEQRYKIFVQQNSYLYSQQRLFYDEKSIGSKDTKHVSEANQYMCNNFYDIRMFGAVMSTSEFNCGQVRGPVQLTFARSVDQVVPMDISITRVALTKPGDKPEGAEEGDDQAPTFGTMGRKALVPYGLYKGHGFFIPAFAERTGVDGEDLALLWEALKNMWDIDRSASRGLTAIRGLYIFTHENALGNAPAHTLFDLIKTEVKPGVEAPRSFNDYEMTIPSEEELPDGVTLTILVG